MVYRKAFLRRGTVLSGPCRPNMVTCDVAKPNQQLGRTQMSITVNTCGGLGNQLFQYAFARSLAGKYSVSLTDACNQYGLQLNHFNITLPIIPHPGWRWIAERSLRFDPSPEIEDNSIIAGYWQTEKYFSHIADTVRAELTLREPLSLAAQTAATLISGTPNSVMVHVRRGDYLTWAAQRHGVLPTSYYLEAAKHFPDSHFFLFSDDSAYHLPFPHTRISCTPYEDLHLMTLCKGAIIANSTLSWWGAWLGADKTGGTIVAPKQWFRTGNEDAQDINPERWIKAGPDESTQLETIRHTTLRTVVR